MKNLKKAVRIFIAIIEKIVFAYIMYRALYQCHGWAESLLIFWVNVQAFFTIVCLFSDEVKDSIREKGLTLPAWINMIYLSASSAAFAAHSWYWSATVMLLSTVLISILSEKTKSKD